MKPSRLFPLLISLVFALPSLAQDKAAPPQWQSSKKADLSSGTRNFQFTLAGKFLTAPHTGAADYPSLIVTCNPDKQATGLLGKFVSANLSVGAPVKIDYIEPEEIKEGISYFPKVTVQYRLNDGKPEDAQWPPNSDKTGAQLDKDAFKKLIYERKAPVRSVEISLNENQAGQIVMQFNMPDPSQMANTCGIAEKK